MDASFSHITIIGVGLLGGSIGQAARRRWPNIHIAGVGRRESSLQDAMDVGAIDSMHLAARECVDKSDLVILATPVGAFETILRDIQPHLRSDALVTDVGSTKQEVVCVAERVLGAGGAFVGSHPMAGTEKKGPRFSDPDLLPGAMCILTPTAATPKARVARIERFWADLGMTTCRMTPAEHDRAVARVSHLPHIAAAMLMLIPEDADLNIAATGLRDTTRLAGGDPEMWRDITTSNREQITAALDALDNLSREFRAMLDDGDARTIESFFVRAKQRRDSTLGRENGG